MIASMMMMLTGFLLDTPREVAPLSEVRITKMEFGCTNPNEKSYYAVKFENTPQSHSFVVTKSRNGIYNFDYPSGAKVIYFERMGRIAKFSINAGSEKDLSFPKAEFILTIDKSIDSYTTFSGDLTFDDRGNAWSGHCKQLPNFPSAEPSK